MTIDLSQFHDVFFDEAEEHLASLESLLLGLDLDAPDTEALNAIFRSAHSIKGGAGTFGFDDMTHITHELETLLDGVRKGTRQLRKDMVDVVLSAGDTLKALVMAHRGGDDVPAETIASIVTALQQMLNDDGAATSKAPAQSGAPLKRASEAYRAQIFISPEADWGGVLSELTRFEGARIIEFPAEVGVNTPLVIDVPAGGPASSELEDSLAFLLPPDAIKIGPIPAPEPETFGFFDPALANADDSFGFFVEPEPVTAATPAPSPAVVEDPAFGLFEPMPDAAPAAAAPVAPAATTLADGEGYGFFAPVAAVPAAKPVETKAPAPVAKVEAKPEAKSDAKQAESASIRVGVDKVDQLLNLVGELVITQSMLAQCAQVLDSTAHEKLLSGIDLLERNTRELQEAVMSIRMLPISAVFNRFPRLVRDLAGQLGKKIDLKLIGEQTELDKGFIEKLSDPLTHLVRNSLDHGIESAEVRRSKGKPETGTLTLCAFHQGGSIVIQVMDDGGGLNRDKILAKARERGMSVSDSLTDGEVFALIFEAGFSTADKVSDISGRGVGMDVVRRNIQQMGGRIDIESMLGVGTTMTLRLPLTLAILDGMSVSVGDEIYLIPLGFIAESLQPRKQDLRTVAANGRVISVREEYLPLVALYEVLGAKPLYPDPSQGLCVILESDGERVALQVDDLLGQQQVVIKNLETNYRKVAGISGATIMGDGRVALIIDVPALVRMTRSRHPATQTA